MPYINNIGKCIACNPPNVWDYQNKVCNGCPVTFIWDFNQSKCVCPEKTLLNHDNRCV